MFSRRKQNSSRQSANTPPASSTGYPGGDSNAIGKTVTWVDRIPDVTVPDMVRWARFPTGPTLVITVGKLGAETLLSLERRMDDCNVVFDYQNLDSLQQLAANYPRFFHIELSDMNAGVDVENSQLKPIVSRIESHRGTIDVHELRGTDGSSPWSWLQTLEGLNGISPRASARLGFQAALQRGQADPLTTALTNLLKRMIFTSVLIVASCDENLGTQIIGDLAALIRVTWPHEAALPIYALIHGQNADAKTTVSALEIASLSSYSRLGWGLPTGMGWNLTNEENRLVDGVFCFLSNARNGDADNHSDHSEASLQTFLWAYLTSEHDGRFSFSSKVSEAAKRVDHGAMYLPAITCVSARSYETPLRFLRDMVAYRAMSLLVEPHVPIQPNFIGHDLASVSGMNAALEQLRPQGIGAWICGYAAITKKPQDQLIQLLRGAKAYFDTELEKCVPDFLKVRAQTNPQTQLSNLCDRWNPNLVDKLAETVKTHLLSVVGLSLTDGSTAEFRNITLTTYLDLADPKHGQHSTFVETLKTKTLALARQITSQVIKENYDLETRLNGEYQTSEFQNDWKSGFKDLTDKVASLILQRPGQKPYQHTWKRYSSTTCSQDIQITYDVNDTVRMTDPTIAVQVALIARSPLGYLRIYQPNDPANVRNLFVYPMQHVTTDIFGWQHNPSINYNLQAALTFRRAFKRFAQCYSNGTLTRQNLQKLQSLPESANQPINWLDILWEFIQAYQRDHGNFQNTVDKLSQQPPAHQAIVIEQTTAFNRYLIEAIGKVAGGNLSYFDEARLT